MPSRPGDQFHDHLDVVHDRTIQGAVNAGATVRSGVTLAVQGSVAGPIVVEEGAILTVQGAFHGEVISNAGLIMVAGVASHRFWEDQHGQGGWALAIGTVIEHDQLQADGTFTSLIPEQEINVDASARGYLVYVPNDGFIPLKDI